MNLSSLQDCVQTGLQLYMYFDIYRFSKYIEAGSLRSRMAGNTTEGGQRNEVGLGRCTLNVHCGL